MSNLNNDGLFQQIEPTDAFAAGLRALLDERDRLKATATPDILGDLPAAGFTIRASIGPTEDFSGEEITLAVRLADGTILRETAPISRLTITSSIHAVTNRLGRRLVQAAAMPQLDALIRGKFGS